MKKQADGRKRMLWIPICIILAVVLIAGLVLYGLLGGNSSKQTQAPEGADKLYWNVDRYDYVSKGPGGSTGRMKRSDGFYYIRFAVEGEQIDIPVEDVALVEWIDMRDLVGLELDERGVCVGVKELDSFTGGIVANNYYVESIDGTTYVCNTSGYYKGVSTTLEIPETANAYDVGAEGLLRGMRTQIEPDDQILAIKNTEGVVTDVFVTPYQMPGDVYWNLEIMYDNVTKTSTRERSATGFFEYRMCFGGEIITVKTRELEIANQMDGYGARCMGLVFDENGYVVETLRAINVCGGTVIGSWYHVMSVDGSTVNMKKVIGGSDKGSEASGVMGRYCKTILTTTGEYTQVKEGDQVHCLTDVRGRIAYIFIINRPSETAKICWNVERQWDNATQKSLRKPDSDGWYRITVAIDGQQRVIKTQDKALAHQVDSYVASCFAVELNEDNEILSTFKAQNAIGGTVTMSWYTVDSVNNGVVTATRRGDPNNADYGTCLTNTLSDTCKIYNVGASAGTVGEVTTVKAGDQIHCFTNFKGELELIYIISRPVDSPVYYNLDRQYDEEKKVTLRTPAQDGYYYFRMAVNGKQVTLKTKDKQVASDVDANSGRCLALQVKQDVIIKAYSATKAWGYTGGVPVSYCDITSINGRTVVTEKRTVGEGKGQTFTIKLAPDCKIYNVSANYTEFAGEPDTIRLGDRIHCLQNNDNQVTIIFIVTRKINGKIGWNLVQKWDSVNETTTRTPDADGWYYFDMAIDGQLQVLKTQDLEVVNAIDSAGARCRGLVLDGDVIKRAVSPTQMIGTDGGINGSWVYISELTEYGCKAYKGEETFDIPMAEDCKVYNVSGKYVNNPGEPTTLNVGAMIHVLVNMDKKATIIYVIKDGVAGASTGPCGACGQNVTWAPWDGTSAMASGIHYYLPKDIHLDTYATVDSVKATLFLNGHTITSDSRAFKLINGASLTIYDSKVDGKDAGGRIIGKGMNAQETEAEGNGGNSEGGVIMLWNRNTTLNLYAGTLELAADHNQIRHGGVVNGGAQFNMYGGTIIGGSVSGQGGAVRIFNAVGAFRMYGGKILGGQGGDGESISLENGAVGTLSDGAVCDGAILLQTGAGLSVSGKQQLSKVILGDEQITIGEGGLKAGSQIGVYDSKDTTPFALGVNGDLRNYFVSARQDFAVIANDKGDLSLKYDVAPHIHCLCAGNGQGLGDHTACEDTQWTPWTDATALPQESGKYYLTCDVSGGQLKVLPGVEISLCLNGHKVHTGGNRALWIYGKLDLTDCSEEKTGSVASARNAMGHVFSVQSAAEFNLFGGNLISEGVASKAGAGIVSDEDLDNNHGTPGTFRMYGGSITGGDVTEDAGLVALWNGGKMFLHGGTLYGGKAQKQGGNICIYGAELVMTGGSITGGQAAKGGGIYVSKNGKLTVTGGSITGNLAADGQTRNNIHLAADAKISIGQLGETDRVGITAESGGVFAENVPADVTVQLFSDDAQLKIKYDAQAQTLRLGGNHDHCLCAGLAEGMQDHETCQQIEWEPWNSATSLPSASGHYYLTCDVTAGQLKVLPGVEISLCLNGHKVHTGGNRALWIYGKLDLTDCSLGQTGSVTSARNAMGHVFSVQSAAEFNLFGGNLISEGAASKAGAGIVSDEDLDNNHVTPGTFRMYGGSITGGDVTEDAGLVALWNGGKMFLHGGTLYGGKAQKQGGNICIYGAELVMTGGTITGGQATKGGGIYVSKNGKLTITGGTVTGNTGADGQTPNNICLAEGVKLTLDQLDQNSRLGITMDVPGTFAENVTVDLSEQILSDNLEMKVKYDGQTLYLGGSHDHCICGGKAQGIGDHSQCQDAPWTKLEQAMFDNPDGVVVRVQTLDIGASRDGTMTVYRLQPGNYFLGEDITLDHMIQVENEQVGLCLSGHTLRVNSRAFRICSSGVVTITDCGENGTLAATGMSDAEAHEEQGSNANSINNEGGLVMLWNSNTALRIYGGTLKLLSVEEGGAASIRNGGILNGNGAISMYGGTLTGGRAGANGGSIRLTSASAVLNLYAGVISNGQAVSDGGNIYMSKGQLNILGGQILGGTSGGSGGNIYLGGDSRGQVKCTISGSAEIRGGDATNKGGNVYQKYLAELTLGGDALITEGKAGLNGGGITCFATKINIGGNVQIRDNEGSDLYLDGNSTATTDSWIVLDGLGENARIGIAMKALDAFIKENTEDLSQQFFSSNSAYAVIWQNNKMFLKQK